jgi:hypothetical protein
MRAAILNRNYIGAHANVYRRARSGATSSAAAKSDCGGFRQYTSHTSAPLGAVGAPYIYVCSEGLMFY